MTREFTLPTARTFSLSGPASLSALDPRRRDRPAGRPGRLPRARRWWPTRTAGSPATFPAGPRPPSTATRPPSGSPGFGAAHQAGDWLQYDLAAADHLHPPRPAGRGRRSPLGADRRHGQHRRSGRRPRPVALPPIADSTVAGASGQRADHLPRPHRQPDPGHRHRGPARGHHQLLLPVAASACRSASPRSASPGWHGRPAGRRCPGTCHSNLLTIDGAADHRAHHRLDRHRAGQRRAARSSPAEPTPRASRSRPAPSRRPSPTTSVGHQTATVGWNLDQLTLDSAPGGGAAPGRRLPATLAATQPATGPGGHTDQPERHHAAPAGDRCHRTLRAGPRARASTPVGRPWPPPAAGAPRGAHR